MLAEKDLPCALLLVVYVAIACVIPAQSDTFYHLRAGQQMWDSHSLITADLFSWTHYGRPLANHWWLSQLAFFALYSVGGNVMLTVVAGLCAFAALVISWRLTKDHGRGRLIALVALLLTLPEWSVRPQVFSLLFMALSLRLLASDRLRLLCALLVLWANMHAVVVLGILIAGVPLLDAILWERSRILRAAAIATVAAAAPLLTPFSLHYWPSLLATVQASRALGLQEYRSAFLLEPTVLAFWAIAAMLIGAVVSQRHRFGHMERSTRVLVLAALILVPAAITSTRNIPFLVLAAVPALSRVIDAQGAALPNRVRSDLSAGAYLQ